MAGNRSRRPADGGAWEPPPRSPPSRSSSSRLCWRRRGARRATRRSRASLSSAAPVRGDRGRRVRYEDERDAMAAFVYGGAVARAIVKMKYESRPDLARPLGDSALARACSAAQVDLPRSDRRPGPSASIAGSPSADSTSPRCRATSRAAARRAAALHWHSCALPRHAAAGHARPRGATRKRRRLASASANPPRSDGRTYSSSTTSGRPGRRSSVRRGASKRGCARPSWPPS